MTSRTRSTSILALIICVALPAWGQQYLLYTPQPTTSGQKELSKDGILVQEVTVQKGDTLYGISRKFSGHGMYYPQILLFNAIKTPGMIHPGNILKVPVTLTSPDGPAPSEATPARPAHKPAPQADKKSAAKSDVQPVVRQSTTPASTASSELSLSDLKSVGTGKTRVSGRKKTAVQTRKVAAPAADGKKSESSPVAAHKNSTKAVPAGQKLFETAVKAYRNEDYRSAVDLFDRYLADNAASPLAADAHLYKAECYLKLSAQ